MKKIFAFVPILTLALSAEAVSHNSQQPLGSNSLVSSQTVSSSAQHKTDALYEALRKSYANGKISADGVVDKALYHKVWSPELTERCLRLVSDKNARAMAELGLLYTHYKTAYMFPGKTDEGVRLLEAATRAGNSDAADYLGVYYNSQGDFDKAKQYFGLAGHDNNPMALTVMGEMYDNGKGYKKDKAKAKECYRRASIKGYSTGASKYGLTLQRQWYGAVNMPDAFAWLYIAGELGDDAARSNLMRPLRGERFGDDAHTALMRRALAIGDAWNAKYGKKISETPLYKEGFKAGLKGHEQDAEHGDDWALFYIGSMSYNDEFLNRSDDLVLKCYEAIVKSNRLPDPAMAIVYERLADMYRNGRGVKANPTQAAHYDRMAADRGSLAAYKIVENISD